MAFDLYLNHIREKITHHEEVIFHMANNDDSYPTLQWLWSEFYNSPNIPPEKSNALVHELIGILNTKQVESAIKYKIEKLIYIFSQSYINALPLKCSSD
ncbi:hypothetical protein TDB9533_02451 [Thalassocella blandensis]|nr:hypothetical protein TDB9533_02451 [Thalassocella blandensis]